MSDDTIQNYFAGRIDDLNQEIRHLSAQIQELKVLMEAKQLEIKLLQSGANSGTQVAKDAERGEESSSNGQGAENGDLREFAELGFRDAIRMVLRNSGRRMKPKEVAAEFRRRSYPYKAKVDLTTRVSNELNRMAKAGHLRKGKGWYAIDEQPKGGLLF